MVLEEALSGLNGNREIVVRSACVHCCETRALCKNQVLLASFAYCPSPRQASDVKGSEVIAKGRVFCSVFQVFDYERVSPYSCVIINRRAIKDTLWRTGSSSPPHALFFAALPGAAFLSHSSSSGLKLVLVGRLETETALQQAAPPPPFIATVLSETCLDRETKSGSRVCSSHFFFPVWA